MVWSTKPISSLLKVVKHYLFAMTQFTFSCDFPLRTSGQDQGHTPIFRQPSFLSVADQIGSAVPIKFPQTHSVAPVWGLTRQSLRIALKSVLTISDLVFLTALRSACNPLVIIDGQILSSQFGIKVIVKKKVFLSVFPTVKITRRRKHTASINVFLLQ